MPMMTMQRQLQAPQRQQLEVAAPVDSAGSQEAALEVQAVPQSEATNAVEVKTTDDVEVEKTERSETVTQPWIPIARPPADAHEGPKRDDADASSESVSRADVAYSRVEETVQSRDAA
jgi:hypothetical protein